VIGQPLPHWSAGILDIHQISTGRGNAAFFRFPDGTTMIVDAGAAGDGMTLPDAEPRPNATRTPGAWIARYITRMMAPDPARIDYAVITHFHTDHMGQVTRDSKTSADGKYKLTGITEVDDAIPIGMIIDRGTSYMPPPDDATMKNYRAFIGARGLKAETIRVGAADQIALQHQPQAFKNFEIRNVAADGWVWSGEGDGERAIFPNLETIPAEDRPSENMCSIGLRIRYGRSAISPAATCRECRTPARRNGIRWRRRWRR
jgi:metallo-beta-lactamase superfamily protein